MRTRHIVIIGITAMLSYEYIVLSYGWAGFSLLRWMVHNIFRGSWRHLDLSLVPGHTISYILGVVGFLLMIVLMTYSLRKHAPARWRVGELSTWLNFHIFCGTLGPILILFHAHFSAKGLVAISYFSMIVCAVSGFIGGYLYSQTSTLHNYWRITLSKCDSACNELAAKLQSPLGALAIQKIKDQAVVFAGGEKLSNHVQVNGFELIWMSILGDLRMKWVQEKSFDPPAPRKLLPHLKIYGIISRKAYFYAQYERFLGYWHAFHAPFALFMYIVAIIHIGVAITFGVHVKMH